MSSAVRPRSPQLVAAVGVAAGASLYLDVAAVGVDLPGSRAGAGILAPALAVGALTALGLVFLQRAVRAAMRRAFADRPGFVAAYEARDAWAYAAFLVLAAGVAGARLSVPLAYAVIVAFGVAQALVSLRALSVAGASSGASAREPFFDSSAWLAILFLLSGMAALVYEVVWQRVLFSVYGVNIESVTMVVSLFMLGLGLGALAGGAVSRRLPDRAPWLFAACEVGIGAFGAVSIPLIDAIGAQTLHLPAAAVGATVFALLLVPVLLMGATLPLLVQHLSRHDPNIGAALGRLYSLNTLGAALASLLTVDVFFVLLGRQATVYVAVALNVVVAVLVFRFATRMAARARASAAEGPAEAAPGAHAAAADASPYADVAVERLPRAAVLVIAFLSGLLSLSQEIVWMRPMAYATQGAPQVFGQVLGVFLVGVAAGAWKAKKLCEAQVPDPLRRLGRTFVRAGVVYYLALPVFGGAMMVSRGLGVPVAFLLVGVIAYLMGLVLPLLVQLDRGARGTAGRGVSHIYAANVAGATAGPLLTGFVLLDHMTFAQCAAVVASFTVVTGAVLLSRASRPIGVRLRTTSVAFAGFAALLYPPLYLHLPERLRDGPGYSPAKAFDQVVHNRSGVLAVRSHPDGDVMYGGGIYDGSFNVGLAKNSNEISRAYMMAALHRAPRRVLQIGLSTGSWTWVVARHEAVERITVVEINPGYEQMIRAYPLQREILEDARIELHYDDGRRWLMRNPEARFDFVLMNTTYHWRSNMTNLLSREFMELCKKHLLPGGVLYFNTTRNPDAGRTAAEVFRHVTTVSTFVAASDAPFDMSVEERRAGLLAYRRDGRSVLEDEGPDAVAALERLARSDLSDRAAEYRANPDLQIITDDNMLPEFKRIHADSAIGTLYRWRGPERPWAAILAGR